MGACATKLPPMLITEVDNLSLPELCDLLVANTKELLFLLNERGVDGRVLLGKKKDVEIIQSAIAKKKSGGMI